MSKMGQYVFEMQEDAASMKKEAFLKKYGKTSESFYNDYQLELDGPSDYNYTEEEQYYEEYGDDRSF